MTQPAVRTALDRVRPFVPAAALDHVAAAMADLPLDLRVVRPRRSKLGDHRPPRSPLRPAHRITLNADLNPYSFLTTLLHELAHAATWERQAAIRRRVLPHGPEWQQEFSGMLAPVVAAGVYPDDIAAAVRRSLARPAAATCSDRDLLLALARYDTLPPGRVRVEDLPPGTWFRVDAGLVFLAGPIVRTRRQCFEKETGDEYRVHGLLLVEPLAGPPEG